MKRYASYRDLLSQYVDPILAEGVEFTVEERSLMELRGWELIRGVFRSIVTFFWIVGVYCRFKWPWMVESKQWDQPLKVQPPGCVGLIMTRDRSLLLEMKLEPGNHGRGYRRMVMWGPPIQFSPGSELRNCLIILSHRVI